MTAIPTISSSIRAVWLREHECFVRVLHGLSSLPLAERNLGRILWPGCLAEGLEAAEAAEVVLSASSENAEGRA